MMDPRKLGLSEEDLAALGYRTRSGSRASGTDPAGTSPDGSPDGERAGARPSAPSSGLGRALRTWLATWGVLLAAWWAASTARLLPAPTPANGPDTVFSSGRAMAQLVDVARAPRPVGSPEHARVRDYLADRLRRSGLDVDSGAATATAAVHAGVVDVATPGNVVARLRGSASTGSVLVAARYDSGPLSPGAGDAGMAVAVVLEAVRVLAAGPPLRNDVVVVLADAGAVGGPDAIGSLGLGRFLASHPAAEEIAFFVAPGMRGLSGPSWSLPISPEPSARPLGDVLSRPVSSSLAAEAAARSDVAGPLHPLVERGVPGWMLVGLGDRAWRAGPLDTAARVDERTMAHQGGQLLELLRASGAHDFAGEPGPTAGEAFTTIRGFDLVTWPRRWVPWTTLALCAGWLGLAFVLRLRGTHPLRLLSGVVLGAAVTGSAVLVDPPLTETVSGAHPEHGHVPGVIYRDDVLSLAVFAAVVGGATVLYGAARLRFGRGELHVGALSVPLVALLWSAFAMPGAAATLQPALALALVGGAVVAVAAPEDRGGWLSWLTTLVFSIGVLLLTVPAVEWIAASLPPTSAVPAIAYALGVLLILPLGDWLLAGRAWWTPALAFAVAAGLVGATLPGVQGPERHPEPTSLALLIDDTVVVETPARVDGSVVDSTSSTEDAPPDAVTDRPGVAPTRRIAGTWLTVEGPGESWARSWAVPGPTGPRGPDGLLLPRATEWIVAGAGAAADLSPPTVELLDAAEVPGGWTARLRVRSGLGAEVVGLRLSGGSAGRIRAVDGATLAGVGVEGPVTAVRRWGSARAEPPVFDLHFAGDGQTVSLDVIEHHLRPAELLGSEFFVRNATVVADASTGSDRVIQRSTVRIGRPRPP